MSAYVEYNTHKENTTPCDISHDSKCPSIYYCNCDHVDTPFTNCDVHAIKYLPVFFLRLQRPAFKVRLMTLKNLPASTYRPFAPQAGF